jgi:hypothetical protein
MKCLHTNKDYIKHNKIKYKDINHDVLNEKRVKVQKAGGAYISCHY